MRAPHDIDSAIDRLDEALRATGLAGLAPPNEVESLAEIAAEVAPYILPADLRRFWERVDPEGIAMFTFPMLHGPAHALRLLRVLREIEAPAPMRPPPMLLPFDYASHCYGTVELGSEWSEGGVVLEWSMDELPLVSHSVGERIEMLAELLSEGRFDRGDGYVSIDHRAEREARIRRLEASGPHRVYGHLRAIPIALESWPAHWLAASGIDLRDREPLGATHTIAELVAAAGEGRVAGRIHGEVVRLIGIGDDTLVLVDDGTRAIDVSCPAGTSPWGPVHRRRFEFEVTIKRPVEAPPELDSPHQEVVRHALAGDLGAAQAAAGALFDRLDALSVSAVASDVRPLD